MDFNFLTNLGFYFSSIPITMFIHMFYKPKYNLVISKITSFILLILMIYLDRIFYSYFMIRFTICISFVYLIVILLCRGSVVKKIAGPFIILAIVLISQTPFEIVLLLYSENIQNLVASNITFTFQILSHSFMIVIVYSFNNIMKNFIYKNNKHVVIILLIVINFFIIAMSVAQFPLMIVLEVPLSQRIFYLLGMTLLSLFLNICLLRYIKKTYETLKVERIKIEMEENYQSILSEYKDKNNEIYKFIRHDVINYIMRNSK